MMSNHWPDGDKVHVANVNVPQSLLATELAGEPLASQLKLVDLIIEGGKIAAIEPPGAASQLPVFDADGGQAWPPFADLHTHLDKGQIWPRASNEEGTLDVA